jgi:hypothetical protein
MRPEGKRISGTGRSLLDWGLFCLILCCLITGLLCLKTFGYLFGRGQLASGLLDEPLT